ncbi:MAG: spermidine/putrescine ABC transporter substrate-binding protein [Anaerolineaceae bacterium]|nr:spermidine/putrescine ABC transporter substrate-binding protein [Anaerolineaceae bacterium]MCB9100634.1 spermidine/putrescine ABC transporter substrate-binding protein [Anaerolineales bacterium]
MLTNLLFSSIRLGLALVILGSIGACVGGTPTPPPTPTPPALAETITFYNWEGDEVESVLAAFTEAYGVQVNYVPFESQEEVVAHLTDDQPYDLVVLEHDFFPELIAAGKLSEIDYRNVPNFKNIWANFRDLGHDPGNTHSVPFTWGSTFLIYRADLIDIPVTSWQDLWQIRSQGKIAMRSSLREPLGVALKSLGYSLNSENPDELNQAYQKLLELKDDIIFVDSYAEAAVPLLADGEVVALVGWAEDVEYAEAEGVSVEYAFPREGAILWGDNFIIPTSSQNKYTAELFLNFLLQPDINAQIVNETYYATANEAAQPLIDAEIRDNPVIFPPAEALKNAEVILPLPPETTGLYNDLWAQFQAQVDQ